MSLTPLDIRKMNFPTKLRGLDPNEVESFLSLVAEELTTRLAENARLEQENRGLRERLDEAHGKQQALQEAMLQAQKLSQDITSNARREAELMVKESEIAGDAIVQQAIEQANAIEGKIVGLRTMRRDLQLKMRNTLDLFHRILEAEMEDEKRTAIIRTLPRKRPVAS